MVSWVQNVGYFVLKNKPKLIIIQKANSVEKQKELPFADPYTY